MASPPKFQMPVSANTFTQFVDGPASPFEQPGYTQNLPHMIAAQPLTRSTGHTVTTGAPNYGVNTNTLQGLSLFENSHPTAPLSNIPMASGILPDIGDVFNGLTLNGLTQPIQPTQPTQPTQPIQANSILNPSPSITDLLAEEHFGMTALASAPLLTTPSAAPEVIDDLPIEDLKNGFAALVTNLGLQFSGAYLEELLSNLANVMESKEQNSFPTALLNFLETNITSQAANLGEALDFVDAYAAFLKETQLNHQMWPHLIQLLINSFEDASNLYDLSTNAKNRIKDVIAKEEKKGVHPLVIVCAYIRNHLNFQKQSDLANADKIYDILEKVGLNVRANTRNMQYFDQMVKQMATIKP